MTAITYAVTIAGTSYSSSTIQNGSITYGRQRVLDNFTPAMAYLQLLNPVTPWSVGDSVTVTGNSVTRFDGRITSLSMDQNVTTVTAVSEGLGYLAGQYCPTFTIDASPFSLYPYITPGLATAMYEANVLTYVQAVILVGVGTASMANGKSISCDYSEADTTFGPGISGSYQFGSTNLLETMTTVAANSSFPLLYEDPAANVYFSAPSSRSGTTTSFPLTTSYVVRASASQQNVQSLLNRATITYTSGTRRVTDLDSVSTYGRRDYAVTTQITDVDDAALKASRIVGSYSNPYWQTNPITVLANNLTAGHTTNLLAAKAGTLLDTSALAAYYPGMENQSYIEGWVERFTRNTSTFDLYLSPWSMTRKPESWQEVTASLQWNSAAIVGLDWLDLITQDI